MEEAIGTIRHPQEHSRSRRFPLLMRLTERLLASETQFSEQQTVDRRGTENLAEWQKDFGESLFPIQITERQSAHLVQSYGGSLGRQRRHLRLQPQQPLVQLQQLRPHRRLHLLLLRHPLLPRQRHPE